MVISAINCPTYSIVRPSFELHPTDDSSLWRVEVTQIVPERDTGDPIAVQADVYVYLPSRSTDIYHQVRDALIELMAHEVRESIHVGGVRLFDPHTVSVKQATSPIAAKRRSRKR